ncbi:gamma-glutamylcyclotransferase family protein [Antrihabitans spumae]|jgi:gamma-glutamylcyclotransferase (GGCT)/AIG2-like uncharacterized protein YtfP|uniref:Gamma-glutamylcyclotransferase family protein n=1 Tax=Antrihabitans spumae TaxID=3373370 RepID=A0ABW7JSN3_9NOCA
MVDNHLESDMSASSATTVRLFSYGTLQDPTVQVETFGRLLTGTNDRLAGYATRMLTITDPDVLALSGAAEHPIVVASDDAADGVYGTVFEITPEELHSADTYEVDDYTRVEVVLDSGTRAWVYLAV